MEGFSRAVRSYIDGDIKAPRSKRANRSGSLVNARGRILDGDVASELGVTRAVDFAHPTSADARLHLVGTQTAARQHRDTGRR